MGNPHERLSCRPNPQLNSDPACIVIRSFSTTRLLGFAQRLGAGVAGYLPSLGSTPCPCSLSDSLPAFLWQ